jgi:hypothetical protein
MQKIEILLISFLTLILASCGNSSTSGPGRSESGAAETGNAIISFKEYEHNFGKITEGEKAGYIFTFENKGTSDLVITSTSTTCGCTVPKFSKKPVKPGEAGSIEVVFDTSGRTGIQSKVITVKSNASVPMVLLKITADVSVNK